MHNGTSAVMFEQVKEMVSALTWKFSFYEDFNFLMWVYSLANIIGYVLAE